MADGHALVDHLHAGGLGPSDVLAGVVAGGFEDLHAAFDDYVEVLVVGRRVDRRQQGDVHAERLVGHRPAAFDLARQILGGRLGQRGEDAQAAGVGDRRGHLGAADPHHAALDDRVLDAEHFRDTGFHCSAASWFWVSEAGPGDGCPAGTTLGDDWTMPEISFGHTTPYGWQRSSSSGVGGLCHATPSAFRAGGHWNSGGSLRRKRAEASAR
ncbi:hypothetical protein D3C78_1120100 [compost metagenome]